MTKRLVIFFILVFLIPIRCVNASSNSFILTDLKTNRMIKGVNIHKKHKTASIAKILTAIVAIEYGNLDLYIEILEEDNLIDGSKVYIENNDKLMLYEALVGLILRSGNDLANAIARNVSPDFVLLMNKKAQEIGMINSHFVNPSGLDISGSNISTPYDMALLIKYCYNNQVFKEIFETKTFSFKTYNKVSYTWKTKHRLLMSNKFFLGGKTGYTKESGRTLASTFNYDDNIFIVVSMDMSNDFAFHVEMLDYIKNNYQKTSVFEGQILDTLYLSKTRDIYLSLNDEEKENIKYQYDDKYVYIFLYDNIIYKDEISYEDDVDINMFIIYVFKELND